MHTLSVPTPTKAIKASFFTFAILLIFLGTTSPVQSGSRNETPRASELPQDPKRKSDSTQTSNQIPPLPNGVVDLKFGDFFVRPIRAEGLQLTPRVLELQGQRVRILGYMVEQEDAPPGRLLLSPLPIQIHEHDNALADDLPPSTVFVYVPTTPNAPIPYVPGLMLLTGILQVGNQTEADGRISVVRLILDPPAKKSGDTGFRNNRSDSSNKGGQHLIQLRSPSRSAKP